MTSEMIRQYSVLVEFLGHALGPDYEVALHDMGKKRPSLVAIANGHISGRTLGAPLTNVALEIVAQQTYMTQDYRLNYRGTSATGKALRCSTFFIKDEKKQLSGLLCINFDDSRFSELSEKIFALCHPDDFVSRNIVISSLPPVTENGGHETFYSSIAAAIDDALVSVLETAELPPDRLTQEEKLRVMEFLNQKGIFMLKGAVVEVAEKLACSQASIYRYLSKLNKEK